MQLKAANSNKPEPTGHLPDNIMHFARVLRDTGVPVGPGAVLDAIEAVQSYVLANLDTVEEVEVNPLIVTQTRAVAADALIRRRHD